jgi:hypothetical protein
MAGIPCGAVTGGGGIDGGEAGRNGGWWHTATREEGAATRGGLVHSGACGDGGEKKSNRYVCVTDGDGG